MNNQVNPMFAKFDQVLGKTTPTTLNAPVSTRADEIRNLAKQAQTPPPDPYADRNIIKNTVVDAGKRAVGDIKQAGSNVHDAITGEGDYAGESSIRRGVEATKEAFSTPVKVASEILPESARNYLGDVSDKMSKGFANPDPKSPVGMLVNNPSFQKWTLDHPDAFKALQETLGTASATGGISGDILTMGAGAEVLDKGVEKMTPKPGKSVPINMNEPAPMELPKNNLLKSANERVTPDYESLTSTQKSKLAAETGADGQPRVKEGGMLSGRTVNQTQSEIDAGTELSKVKGYSEKLSDLETHNLIKEEIKTEAGNLRTKLAGEKVAIPKKEIISTVKKAIDVASEDSLLLSKTDPVVNNYLRVAQKAATQSSGNLEGILDTRQALDEAYYNARGKMAYGDTRINTLDEIHQSARNALNKMLDDNSQSVDVKASLKKQSNLYRADDGILPKIGKEDSSKIIRTLKNTKVGKFAQRHPYLTGGATTVVGDKVIKATTGFGL